MPIPITESSDSNISPQRIKKLEQELTRLRREVGSLQGSAAGDGSRGAIMGYITTIMAAFGALLGLVSLFRH